MEKYGRAGEATDDNIRVIRYMRIASCVTKAADIHSEYVTINAFARQE